MFICNFAIILVKRGFTPKLCLLFFTFVPSMGYTQSAQFTKDSIPVIEGEVVFTVNFELDLSKEEFHQKTYLYLNNELDPYSGTFLLNNIDSIVCNITDYIDIESNAIHVFGMYMTYSLKMVFNDRFCTLTIKDITYMEKGYFEIQEESERKLNMPEYSGKDIMIDKKYVLLMTRNASERITDASVKRINEIIKNSELFFVKK